MTNSTVGLTVIFRIIESLAVKRLGGKPLTAAVWAIFAKQLAAAINAGAAPRILSSFNAARAAACDEAGRAALEAYKR